MLLVDSGVSFSFVVRSIFIWRPKEKFESKQKDDERKIVLCGKNENKRKGKFEDDSDDDFGGGTHGSKSLKAKKLPLTSKAHGSKRKY